jgi:hypothetical protein
LRWIGYDRQGLQLTIDFSNFPETTSASSGSVACAPTSTSPVVSSAADRPVSPRPPLSLPAPSTSSAPLSDAPPSSTTAVSVPDVDSPSRSLRFDLHDFHDEGRLLTHFYRRPRSPARWLLLSVSPSTTAARTPPSSPSRRTLPA